MTINWYVVEILDAFGAIIMSTKIWYPADEVIDPYFTLFDSDTGEVRVALNPNSPFALSVKVTKNP